MIPQRNLSLLANRLHKEHGGRRIPESVLERDYCLAWFLTGLSRSQLSKLLIFKGGTALKRCNFGDYRFSEDLDFTLARAADFAEIRDGLEEVYQHVAQASAFVSLLIGKIGRAMSTATLFTSAIKVRSRIRIQSRWTSPSRRPCSFQSSRRRFCELTRS